MSTEEVEAAKKVAELERMAYAIVLQRLKCQEQKTERLEAMFNDMARHVGYSPLGDHAGRNLPGVPRDQRPHA